MTEVADALVVFGITGDLARTKTLPALYDLVEQGILTCPVIGVGRRPLREDEMREHARSAIEEAKGDGLDRRVLDTFLSRLTYVGGDAMDDAVYEQLEKALGKAQCPVFYLAIPPAAFLESSEHLARAGLLDKARLVVEKPFGTDLVSARDLNRRLTALVPEERLYRIDHFLGKEPVQDIMFLRFSNALFEPVWSREHVDSIQVTMAEDFGVEGRGAFYDRVGALRDVVQNHLLQVLALVTMEPPAGDDDAVSRHRLDVFRSMPSVDPTHAVRGQYQGYDKIDGVQPGSDTETFVGLRLMIENWRWSGVPIFVRAGKGMPVNATEIVVRLQHVPELRYGTHRLACPGSDDIVFRIGRDAGMTIALFAKTPGKEDTREVSLDVSFIEELGKSPGTLRAAAHGRAARRHVALPALGRHRGDVADRAAAPRSATRRREVPPRHVGAEAGGEPRTAPRRLARAAVGVVPLARLRAMSWSEWADAVEIEPSIYASDFSRLGAQLETLHGAGAKVFHFDVGDGHFIPEVTVGPIVLASISPFVRGWGAKLDCHLMVTEPERHFEAIARAGGDSVTFHVEASDDPARAVAAARSLGLGVGVAFNPETVVSDAVAASEGVDLVLCMSIHPGYSGQAFMDGALGRIAELRAALPVEVRVQVDGGINRETVHAAREAGADLLVAGSAVFWSDDPGAAFGDLVEVARA